MKALPIKKTETCWLWLGTRTNNGYGVVCRDGKSQVAHRYLYKQLVGEIGEGLQLDHLCGVKHCVNPEHLEPVTRLENVRRYYKQFDNRCTRGHKYTEENTVAYSYKGKLERRCRLCSQAYQRARWLQKKAELQHKS